MGQAKRNPVALAAKRGEIPSKKPRMGKREVDRLIKSKVVELMIQRGLMPFM